MTKVCKVYTLDGEKLGTASDAMEIDHWPYTVHEIKTDDGSISMYVNPGVYKRKFMFDDKPTFYSC